MIAKVQFFIQTRSITKTVTGDWFDMLGPYQSKEDAVEKAMNVKSRPPREFRIISRTDEILETIDR
jgi:hypothetical protein